MVLTKSIEFFDPVKVRGECHIIGCGSVGSTIAESLVRLGVKNITLYDFDRVEAHNLVNQMFGNKHIGMMKTDALADVLSDINPDVVITKHNEGFTKKNKLSGFVFLAVDNIDLRRQICSDNLYNSNIKAVFDVRTSLLSAQSYAADWSNMQSIKNLIDTMDFTHEEAKKAAPMTACHMEIGVAPTVRVGSILCVTNFMNFILKKELKTFINVDPYSMYLDQF